MFCLFFQRSNIRFVANLAEELVQRLVQMCVEAHLSTVYINNAVFLDSQISDYLTDHINTLLEELEQYFSMQLWLVTA
jgi:hypothetical protein